MSFRMRPEVDDWFKHIFKKGPLQTKFDIYYLCLMMGLAVGRTERPVNAQEFIEYFVADYRPVQRLVIGLLVVAEVARLGVELSEREDVQGLINRYLDPANPAHLREEGFARLNDYANAGFETIVEAAGPSRPHHVEAFIQGYVRELSRQMQESALWSRFLEPAS